MRMELDYRLLRQQLDALERATNNSNAQDHGLLTGLENLVSDLLTHKNGVYLYSD